MLHRFPDDFETILLGRRKYRSSPKNEKQIVIEIEVKVEKLIRSSLLIIKLPYLSPYVKICLPISSEATACRKTPHELTAELGKRI